MKIAVYLDQDCNGNDLCDSVGNPIPAGWYLYEWPIGEPRKGPFENETDALKEGWFGDEGGNLLRVPPRLAKHHRIVIAGIRVK